MKDFARCSRHGGYLTDRHECQTVGVLADVAEERAQQFARYGTNEDVPDGTGPEVEWIPLLTQNDTLDFDATSIEVDFRADYEQVDAAGQLTFMHLVREEIAEAFAESDPQRLREELIQVAALAVSWVEKIDARTMR